MQFELASIFFFVGVGVSVPLLMLTLGWLVRPSVPGTIKSTIYECGEIPVQQAWFNFNPRFYIIALIYIVFDVEIAFIYPIAVVFKRWVAAGQGMVAFVEVITFVAILLLGLVYVWAEGDLEWIRTIKGEPGKGEQGRMTKEESAAAAHRKAA